MNKQRLNEVMNCQCLQSIIETDKKKYTFEDDNLGQKTTCKANDNSKIIFECYTSFHKTVISNDRTKFDRKQEDYCGIPFFYCPVCGTKTKLNIRNNSYYSQFQK